MNKNTNHGVAVKSVEKKPDSKDDLLAANKRGGPMPLRDAPGGGT
jgi:hypothetical protein